MDINIEKDFLESLFDEALAKANFEENGDLDAYADALADAQNKQLAYFLAEKADEDQ